MINYYTTIYYINNNHEGENNMEELLYYSKFTIKVFEYYNGKINGFNNNAILSINPVPEGHLMGLTHFPNTIEIFIQSILDAYKDDNKRKLMIIRIK